MSRQRQLHLSLLTLNARTFLLAKNSRALFVVLDGGEVTARQRVPRLVPGRVVFGGGQVRFSDGFHVVLLALPDLQLNVMTKQVERGFCSVLQEHPSDIKYECLYVLK